LANLKLGAELTENYPIRSEHAAANVALDGKKIVSAEALMAFMEKRVNEMCPARARLVLNVYDFFTPII